jgi:hypothetical protein
MLKTKCFKLTIALIVLMGTCIISSGQSVSVAKLPNVEDFTITFLEKPTAAGNAVLTLKFSSDARLPEGFNLQLDKKRTVEFLDSGEKSDIKSGDGIFTGLGFFTKSEILTPQLRKGGTFPIFSGRQFVGYKTLPPVKGIVANQAISINAVGNPSNIDPERSLLIRDPGVVQDKTRTRTYCREGSMGVWSFGYLMTEMANESLTGINPQDFVLKWLYNWADDQTVNTWTIGERREGLRRLIEGWAKDDEGRLDLSKAPFRLLAIVNRPDLRGDLNYDKNSKNNAGELRFVFGMVDPENCEAQRFTVIFEYGVKKDSCQSTQEWAKRWKNLDLLDLGSPEYNEKLEGLTEEIVTANANPDKANGSALNQLRTNDFVLDRPWELREFQIGDGRSTGFLRDVTTKQTPDASINGTDLLTEFINQNETDLLTGSHVVPETFLGRSFLGGGIEYDSSDFWNSDGINNNDARHQFSLATCNSCHGRETDTGFLHIQPVGFGNSTADLSGFLRGSTPDTSDIEFLSVADPVDSTKREFNDLLRRAADLDALINTPCTRVFAINSSTSMTH